MRAAPPPSRSTLSEQNPRLRRMPQQQSQVYLRQPEQCKRCLDHGLTCIRPEYQRLKKAKAKLAHFQQQANLSQDSDRKPRAASLDEEADELLPERPVLAQDSPTALFSNASYGKSSQLLHNLHSVTRRHPPRLGSGICRHHGSGDEPHSLRHLHG